MNGTRQQRAAEHMGGSPGRWAVLGTLLLTTASGAELPDYTLQLQARTNLVGNASGAYNVAPGNLLAGSLQVPITLDRQVAFRLQITPEGEGRSAVWWGREGQGRRIYVLPEIGVDARTSDPGLNSAGDIAFAVAGASSAAHNGIYLMNASDPSQVRIIREPLGVSDWQSLWLNEAGQLGGRALITGSRAYVLLSPKDKGFEAVFLAKENSLDGESPYSFLYSPTLNDRGQMAGVGDLKSADREYYQELRVFNPDGTSTLIAQSRGLEPASPVFRFASVQPALNNKGWLAFQGYVRDSGGRNLATIWLWDGAGLKVIAQSGQGDIKEVEAFPPDLNDSGLVVFRAIDSANLRAVWVSDGQTIERVVSEHDVVASDLGPARVDQEQASSPVFAGGPLINARGDITLAAGLAPPENNQEEWGTAVFIARSSFPPPGQPDAGVDAGSGELPDAGPGETPDGGFEDPPGAPDAGPSDPPPGEEPDSGCGCQATSTVALWPWLLLGLARLLSARGGK